MSSHISSHDLLERPQAAVNPKLILPLGRGRSGKSFWARWLIDRAIEDGAPLQIGEGDGINPSLSPFYNDIAQAPDHLYPGDCAQWLESFISSQIEARRSAVLDLGGVIWALGPWFSDLSFGPMLREAGMDVVAVHLVLPDRDSLFYLSRFQAIIQPTHTIIVLNEREIDPHDVKLRFAPILEQPALQAALDQGAILAAMPRLGCPEALDAIRIRRKAGDKSSHIPVGQDFQIVTWRRQMEENFAPVAGWLA